MSQSNTPQGNKEGGDLGPNAESTSNGPTGLARTLALASLRGFEAPAAGYIETPDWLTDEERLTLPPAFDPSRGGPCIGQMKRGK